jgi:hypothetical protein
MPLMERIIRAPESLEAAEKAFVEWLAGRGMVVVSHLHSYWQPRLFEPEVNDALVEATVRRRKR